MKLYILSVLIFVLIGLRFSYSDLPVHCEYHQVKGTWKLTIGEISFNKDIIKYCNAKSNPFKVKNEITVDLNYPNIVLNSETKSEIGTWTMIFDQGFEIRIKNNYGEDVRYFAFFKYTNIESSDKTISHCDTTFTGTYGINGSEKKGCFSAIKTTKSKSNLNLKIDTTDFFKSNNQQSINGIFKNDKNYINYLNSVQSSWVAGENKDFEGKTIHEVQKMMGKKMTMKRWNSHKKHMKTMKMNSSIKKQNNINFLPTNFSWRNVSGINYVPMARHQMNCGSCYIFSMVEMFASRERIVTKNKIQNIYSPQYIVNCNPWGQGCDGGMPYLMSKYAQEFGVIKEDCQPYLGSNEYCYESKCLNHHAQFVKYRSKSYNYVGGYYGASNEENMMQEIYENGPIAIAFQVYDDLVHYKGGVYRHVPSSSNKVGFEPANHAVLITGWGVHNGEKYWEVRNSWGDDFGMKGYFWILRGVDECSVESLASWLKF